MYFFIDYSIDEHEKPVSVMHRDRSVTHRIEKDIFVDRNSIQIECYENHMGIIREGINRL